jgi:hypothetical protein
MAVLRRLQGPCASEKPGDDAESLVDERMRVADALGKASKALTTPVTVCTHGRLSSKPGPTRKKFTVTLLNRPIPQSQP